MMSPVCLIFLVFPLASVQSIRWGPCPTLSYQADFNLEQYRGRWYEIEGLPSYWTGSCDEIHFDQDRPRVTVSTKNDGEVQSMTGTVHQNSEEPAKLEFIFDFLIFNTPWWVVSTDYSTVASVYSCSDFLGIFHWESAWINSRTRYLDPAKVKEAKEKIQRQGIDISAMMVTDQTGCED